MGIKVNFSDKKGNTYLLPLISDRKPGFNDEYLRSYFIYSKWDDIKKTHTEELKKDIDGKKMYPLLRDACGDSYGMNTPENVRDLLFEVLLCNDCIYDVTEVMNADNEELRDLGNL